jgi:hypothetical protein
MEFNLTINIEIPERFDLLKWDHLVTPQLVTQESQNPI